MNILLCVTVLIAVFGGIISANPLNRSPNLESDHLLDDRLKSSESSEELVLARSRRSPQQADPSKRTNIYAEGNHSKAGTNIFVQGQHRVWQSPNRMNDIHLQGNYGQHFGGPYGRSPPSFGGGITFTHRF